MDYEQEPPEQEPSEQHKICPRERRNKKTQVTLENRPVRAAQIKNAARSRGGKKEGVFKSLLFLSASYAKVSAEKSRNVSPLTIFEQGFGKTDILIWLPARILGARLLAQGQEAILDEELIGILAAE